MPETPSDAALLATIDRLERDARTLRRNFRLVVLGVVAFATAGFVRFERLDRGAALRAALLGPDSVLQLRGLQILDARGVTRVRLGAPLPGPIVGGKEVKRVAPVSGFVVMDGDGDERGGFATADGPGDKSEAFIGLDSKDGQVSLFLANPHDGANFQIWDQRGNAVRIYAVGGTPRILVSKDGKIVTRIPADSAP